MNRFPIVLSDLRGDDMSSVARLWRESWISSGLSTPEDPSVDSYRDRLERETWSVRLACIDGEIVGFLAYQPAQEWLRQLFVDPSAQRIGVGTFLLDAARRAMPGGFWLRTDVNNVAARRFYERRGLRLKFEEVHPITGHPTAVYAWP